MNIPRVEISLVLSMKKKEVVLLFDSKEPFFSKFTVFTRHFVRVVDDGEELYLSPSYVSPEEAETLMERYKCNGDP